MRCANWLENRHVISGHLSHNLSHVKFLPFFLEEMGRYALRFKFNTFNFTITAYISLKERNIVRFVVQCFFPWVTLRAFRIYINYTVQNGKLIKAKLSL
jgi:hypothetical protein